MIAVPFASSANRVFITNPAEDNAVRHRAAQCLISLRLLDTRYSRREAINTVRLFLS